MSRIPFLGRRGTPAAGFPQHEADPPIVRTRMLNLPPHPVHVPPAEEWEQKAHDSMIAHREAGLHRGCALPPEHAIQRAPSQKDPKR